MTFDWRETAIKFLDADHLRSIRKSVQGRSWYFIFWGSRMFVLSMPVEQLEPPMVMIAQASPAQQRHAQFHRTVGVSGQVSLLERPMHGTIKMDKEGDVQYTPTSGYAGSDRAIFLVEMDRQKYRVVFSLNLLSQVPDRSEYYDPYGDKKYCPYGKYWRFSGNVEAAWNVR